MKSLLEEGAGGSMSLREDSTVRVEWLEALVKDVETDISSSQEEEELGLGWLFHVVLVSFQEEIEFGWRYHQFNGVTEVATVFPALSSVISL